MSQIRAVVVDPTVPGRLAIGEVDPPGLAPSEALIRVAATSLNRGEVHVAQSVDPGPRLGSDLAGIVEQSAPDGSGPPAGARVVGVLQGGAWAEVVSVPTHSLAELPSTVSFAQAATLPVAGLTALHAIERGGNLLGRSVLITGASGGVGHFAVQLARLSGARVVALVRREACASVVRQAGAHEVVVGDDASGAVEHRPYDLIVESVGGRTLSTALELIAAEGICVTFGFSESATTTIDLLHFFLTGGTTLFGLFLFKDLQRESAGKGLARLVRMVDEGQVRPHIGVEAPWTQIGEIAQSLLDRRFVGKAVLHITAIE